MRKAKKVDPRCPPSSGSLHIEVQYCLTSESLNVIPPLDNSAAEKNDKTTNEKENREGKKRKKESAGEKF